ncbi:MAG TPA: MarR family winged helix-turn-helix transcriptional regulator [Solirubrobacteraceae bacterium]|nr:MarR family winged helix-turn-helix transcriptional regulator [Solirubrobacteraceae bacterium]
MTATRTPRQEPGQAAGEPAFQDAFDTLAAAIRRARGTRQDGRDALTLSQFSLLTPLADGSPRRVRELAQEAGIAASTATRILDALERRAIIDRSRSDDDRRGVTVSLTTLGRAALARQETWMRRRQRAFYEQLPEVERVVAPDLLVRLAALIDEIAAGPA